MREYGQVQVSFWSNPDNVGLSDQGKLLAVYLLTGPHSNGLGCYRLPDGYVVADLGWNEKTVSKGFQELFRIGFCERCETTKYVLIPNFLKWNPVANQNVAKARESEFNRIPKNTSVFSSLCSSLKRFGNHWSNGFETVLKRYAKQEPIQSNPILPKPEPSTEGEGASAPDTPKRKKFTPPSLQEVKDYCAEKGYSFDPDRFIAHYTANGWRVGKNPMKDWKAACVTWQKGEPTRKVDPASHDGKPVKSSADLEAEARQTAERFKDLLGDESA